MIKILFLCHGTTEGLLLRRVKVDCVEVIVKRVYM